jgi:hypothetical protein
MLRRITGLCAAIALFGIAPLLQAKERPGLALTVDVSHVAKDTWRVDYHFSRPVTAIRLDAVGDYRQRAWKVLTPRLRLTTQAGVDLIGAGGKPFTAASVEIATYDGRAPKSYAPFNRYTDGGTAVFLGHLQGDAARGKQAFAMLAEIRLQGLAQENVIAPPHNKQIPGGPRGYAYFGPAQPVRVGTTRFLIDPQTPDWARATLQDAGGAMAQYYEKAYQRPLQDELLVMVSVAGFASEGFSLNGGAVMGQLAYRFDGKQVLGDHPKKRDLVARLVAHEMAHLWQMNMARGGVGDDDPWIHEGGAEAMALDGLLQTGLSSPEKVAEYRAAQTAVCEKLGDSVASYDGIYACGLLRFDRLGVGIVPLWRALIRTAETSGEVYSDKMIATVVAGMK